MTGDADEYARLRDAGYSHDEAVARLKARRAAASDATAARAVPRPGTVASRLVQGTDILESPDARGPAVPVPIRRRETPVLEPARARASDPVETQARRAISFETGNPVLRLARSAERGIGQAVAGLGLRDLGDRLMQYAVPRPESMTVPEKLTALGTGLYATGAAANLAARAGAGLAMRAGIEPASRAGQVLFPPSDAGYGRRVLSNYVASGSGPLLDAAYAASEPGDLGDKATAFGASSLYSLGGAGLFEGLRPLLTRGARVPLGERGAVGAGQEDLVGRPEPVQETLFGDRAGTPASRNLASTERATAGELERLRQEYALSTDPPRRQALAQQIADRERLVQRGEKIGADELATRRAAEPKGGAIAPLRESVRRQDLGAAGADAHGGAEILAGMASGGLAGGAAGAQVGDDPDERLRHSLIGAGFGMVAGSAAGAKLAVRSRFLRKVVGGTERGGVGVPVIAPTPDDAAKIVKKYKKLSDAALSDRIIALHGRARQAGYDMDANMHHWTREGQHGMHVGTTLNYTYGRAKNRMAVDDRLIAEVEWEMRRRGFNDQQLDAIESYGSSAATSVEERSAASTQWRKASKKLGKGSGISGGRLREPTIDDELAGIPLREPAPPSGYAGPGIVEDDLGRPEIVDRPPLTEPPPARVPEEEIPPIDALDAPLDRGTVATPPSPVAAPVQLAEPLPPPPPAGPPGAGAPPKPPPTPPRVTTAETPEPAPEPSKSEQARAYLNVPRFAALDPRLRGVLEDKVLDVATRTGRVPKEKVPWAAVEAKSADLLQHPERLLSVTPERMTQAESLAMATMIQSNVKEMDRLGQGVKALDAIDDVRTLGATLGALDEQTTTLLDKLMRGSSDAGRRLNSLKILAGLTNSGPVWLLKATRHAERPLTDLERATIERLLSQGHRAQMLKYVTGLKQLPWWRSVLNVWKAGLLTNPATHVVNLTGNTSMAVGEQLARQPAAMADWVLGQLGTAGVRTKTPGFTLGAKGLHQGFAEARDVMRGLPVADDLVLGRLHGQSGTSGSALVDAYTNTIFRLLGAADRIGNRMAFRSSLAEQASIRANTEGLTGAKRRARLAELVQAPTDEMAMRASHDALVRTFQDETVGGRFAKGLQQTLSEVAVPFTRTPGAIATRAAEYTPLGFVAAGVQGTKAVAAIRAAVQAATPITPELQRMQQAAAEAFGRGVVGTGLMAAGAYLYQNGLASGTIDPDERSQRQTQQLAGIPNDGIRIPGTDYWVEPSRMGIPAMVLLMGAAIGQAASRGEDKGVLSQVGQGLGTYMRVLSDQPFFRGLDDLLDVRKDPVGAGARYGRGLAGSTIPAGLAAVARATDDRFRQVGTTKEMLYSRLPGLSRRVPAQVDQLGEASRRTAPGAANNMFLPFRISRDRLRDPLIGDLYRSGAAIGRMQKRPSESSTAYTDRARLVGSVLREQLEQVRAAPGYPTAEPDDRAAAFERQSRRVRTAATKAEKTRFLRQAYEAARGKGRDHEAAVAEAQAAWAAERR